MPEGYHFQYRESEVEQYHFNEKNYPEAIGVKEVQSHRSEDRQYPEKMYNEIGMKKAVSVVTR